MEEKNNKDWDKMFQDDDDFQKIEKERKFEDWDKMFQDEDDDFQKAEKEKKFEDWDKILESDNKNQTEISHTTKSNLPIQKNDVNPFMTAGENIIMWLLFIGGGFFIWRGFNVIIGVGLNLFVGFSLVIGGIILVASIKNRIKLHQNIPHICTNCGKTMYLTEAQDKFVKSGNKVRCPYCNLDSN